MQQTVRGFQNKWIWVFSFCLTGFVGPAFAQDASPLQVKAYVFALAKADMQSYLQDGLSRAEMDTLQKERFAQGTLLPGKEPLTLKAGDNPIDISPEAAAILHGGSGESWVMFLFDISTVEGVTLHRRSWTVSGEGKESMVKEGDWKIPTKSESFRCLDYRFASNFLNSKFVYQLSANIGGQTVSMQLNLNLPEKK